MSKIEERVKIFCNTVQRMKPLHPRQFKVLTMGLAKLVYADGNEAGMQKGFRLAQVKRKPYQKA